MNEITLVTLHMSLLCDVNVKTQPSEESRCENRKFRLGVRAAGSASSKGVNPGGMGVIYMGG